MGIDIARLANHSMYFATAQEKLKQVEQFTGMPVFTGTIGREANIEPPDDFNGWAIYVNEGKTLQDHVDEGDLISISQTNETGKEESFEMSPHLIDFYSEDVYFGRWFEMKCLADDIREHGLPSLGNYSSHPCNWQLQHRKNYFEYCKKLGTTASIIFCCDMHPEWLEYFVEDKWAMEQFIEWGRQQFIFVNFQDFTTFEFPEKKPDYYNVFIYDDFADLK